jgi:hypothetical protein
MQIFPDTLWVTTNSLTGRSSDFSYVFRPADTWILKPGMVFHMYTVAKGLAFSETFLLTDTEGERLTRS